MDKLDIKNIAFYTFFKPAYDLETAREILHERMHGLEVKGTILLANEGINCSLSGPSTKMDAFLEFLFKTIGISVPELKISYSQKVPFKRALVKVKPFIVAKPGETPIDPGLDTAPYLSPEEFHQWIKDNKKMVVLDTRNDYEFHVGRFKNALHLGTKHFADFEDDLQKAPEEWQSIPVVTFCTGGIRCEKAAPLMLKKCFQEVYQLDGGILNYFKKIGRGYFEGECFVFDERVALDEKLREPGMKKNNLILALSLSLLLLNMTSAFAQTAAEFQHLGNVSGKQGKYPQAILNYTKAIESDPNFASAYYNRGFVYIEMRKYKLAIADLDKAVELRPKYAAAYHVRGIAYFYKKKYTQAIADYSKSIELDPTNTRYYKSRLSVYFKLGNSDKAWTDVIKIQQLGGVVNPSIINLLKGKKYRD